MHGSETDASPPQTLWTSSEAEAAAAPQTDAPAKEESTEAVASEEPKAE